MTFDDFIKTNHLQKPYALMDLDDTLFQTKRKLAHDEVGMVVASVDKQGKALSFFTQKQAHFFHWLSTHTTLIPVTARDRAEIGRVKLPFESYQILTHGAMILDKHGKPVKAWEDELFLPLSAHQDKLVNVMMLAIFDNDDFVITPHVDVFEHEQLMIYLAIKHRQKDHEALSKLAQTLTALPEVAQDFYIHVNANNLAILPHFIHKKHAVHFLKTHFLNKNTPCFGFGDSLADLPFLQLLDWYGTPHRGQVHEFILDHLSKTASHPL